MNLSDLKTGDLAKNPATVFYGKWAAVYAGILIAVIAAGSHFSSSGAKTRGEIAAIRSRLASMPEASADAQQRAAIMDMIKQGAAAESRQFIPAGDIPNVLSAISHLAGQRNVTLKKVNTLAAKEIGTFPYRSVPIVIQAEGEFQEIGSFLTALKSTVPFDFTWERIEIKRAAKPRNVQIDVRVSFYTRNA